jgi:hypothetical protein
MRTAIMALLFLLIWGGTAAAKDEAAPALVPLQVKQVVLVEGAPAVLLLDRPQQRYLLMFIDFFMANAIRMGMEGPQLERPLTHDLIGILLRRLGAKVTRITITDLKDNTYYALISVQVNGAGEVAEFDARPSDALALAVRSDAPIFAAPALLKPIQSLPAGPGDTPRSQEPPTPEERAAKGKT